MIQRFCLLFCLLFLVACDDGDIITIDLDFEGDLERCENDTQSYLLYDTRVDPNESLILIIARDDNNEALFIEPTQVGVPATLTIGNETRFIFRSYNRAIVGDELCDTVTPGDLSTLENFEADSGTVNISTTIIDDDGDGIPSADENQDPNGDGNFSDAQDSDLDGIPDYIDQDDDNDNVLTSRELLDDLDTDGDGDPLTNMLDTDGDGTPNYLDNDDDGDGIPTRLEDITEEQNPRDLENFAINMMGINIYRYLSTEFIIEYADSGFIFNTYTRSVATSFTIENAGLEIINAQIIDFGTFDSSFVITNEPEDN